MDLGVQQRKANQNLLRYLRTGSCCENLVVFTSIWLFKDPCSNSLVASCCIMSWQLSPRYQPVYHISSPAAPPHELRYLASSHLVASYQYTVASAVPSMWWSHHFVGFAYSVPGVRFAPFFKPSN